MTDWLVHVTLNTGHSRRSPRSEVGAETLSALAPLVRAGGGELVGPPGYHVIVTRQGPCALYTVERVSTPRAPFRVARAPLVTAGLATTEDGAGDLWEMLRQLHERAGLRVARVTGPGGRTRAVRPIGAPPRARRPRRLPWLGIVLLPGLAMLREQDIGRLGDLERCLAWAILAEPLH